MTRPTLAQVYGNSRMAALLGIGFASGLPNVLANDTLTAWLSARGIDVAQIGLFSLIGLPYALKVLWAPVMDRFIPIRVGALGRRRSWLLLTQVLILAAIIGVALTGPEQPGQSLGALAVAGVALVLFSASQDIVADAYRADVVEAHELGAGAAVFVTGYRIATIVGGALALIVAEHFGWRSAYVLMAGVMCVGVVATLWAPEPRVDAPPPQTLTEAIVEPVESFVRLRGWGALLILLFVLVFRLPDLLAAKMTNPLLLQELKFQPGEVGVVRQFIGLYVMILGALLGGGIVARIGLMRSLIVFGVLQSLSNAGFWVLAAVGHDKPLMIGVIVVESLCGGLVTAGFVAFLMSCCDRRYSATQYALFTSLMALANSIGGVIAGYLVREAGYTTFFGLSIAAGLPGMLLLPWIARRTAPRPDPA